MKSDIEKVIELRDSENLKWKEIESIIGISQETLRKAYKRKLYCSDECKYKSKNYSSIEEVTEQYKLLHSWEKVAQHFNLTRKIIQGIRNKDS